MMVVAQTVRPLGLKPRLFLALDAALKRRSSTVLQASIFVHDFIALCDMDFHLIDGVVEVAAGVPGWG